MKQRMHIIHEIRALESTRALRHGKLVDLSSTGGHKLLGEMSIVEVSLASGSRSTTLETIGNISLNSI